jgi:hypothetical protein
VNRGTTKDTNALIDEKLPSYQPISLQAAKDFYYESLPRRIPDPKQPTGFRLANIGELQDSVTGVPSRLYRTNESSAAFNDFGVGVSLYFKSLKALFCVLFLCAFISLVAMYHNKQFNPDQDTIDSDRLDYPNSSEDPSPTPLYLIGTVYGAERSSLALAHQGSSDILCCIFICIFALIAGYMESKVVEEIDLSQQTTQDYSILIKNPPKEVTDPQVYNVFTIFSIIY